MCVLCVCVCVRACVRACVCVCSVCSVCVCVSVREREKERELGGERDRQTDRQCSQANDASSIQFPFYFLRPGSPPRDGRTEKKNKSKMALNE